ncbi:MAG TPA: glucose 1-dehydrogenase [Alphaproteobacteria bacterium]|nr:glucose 1-dehydrogenase [Alphaproteobacteria bacterium]
MKLEDKIAIVTGAASGFGEGIARRFAAEGARVLVADIDADGAVRVAGEIGRRAVPFTVDVSRNERVKAMVEAAIDCFGGLDVLVNNAGTTHKNGPMLDVDEATFDRIYAVNVKSIYLAALHAVPVFRKQKGGVIVNITSTAGVRPRPGLTWYNGSKGAAITLTKSMAAELAPDNIRVNGINPVMGETGLIGKFLPGEDTPEARARVIAGIPLGRLSRPEDIASACLFLASDEAAFITGVCLEVDGGRCI